MSIKNSIIEERQKNLCATLQEIGNQYGVSREYVRQVLSKAGLPTKKFIQKYICNNCGEIIKGLGKLFCSYKCKHEFCYVSLICDQCGQGFKRRQSNVKASLRFNNPGKKWFCSNKCQGSYVAKHFGFIAHPENAKFHKKIEATE